MHTSPQLARRAGTGRAKRAPHLTREALHAAFDCGHDPPTKQPPRRAARRPSALSMIARAVRAVRARRALAQRPRTCREAMQTARPRGGAAQQNSWALAKPHCPVWPSLAEGVAAHGSDELERVRRPVPALGHATGRVPRGETSRREGCTLIGVVPLLH